MITKALLPRLKIGGLLAMAVLVIVLVFQNTHAVDTRMLFITVNMPLAALLAFTLLIGFATGVLAAMKAGRQRTSTTD